MLLALESALIAEQLEHINENTYGTVCPTLGGLTVGFLKKQQETR